MDNMSNVALEETAAVSAVDVDAVYELSDVEVETLRRAALERSLPHSPTQRKYSRRELLKYGMVREGYTTQELKDLGFGPEEVSCFDERAKTAQELLRVDAPFGSGIKKWQLPIGTKLMRMEQTIFPPNTVVRAHVHPQNSPDDPGGGLRIVTKGKIFYKGREYGPGDWFFVPNGVPYTFTTDSEGPTFVMYRYRFFGDEQENRFSHPHEANADF
jgi:hypothetical protein